jgi:hypothetical protein
VEHLTHLWRYLRARPPEHQAFYHIAEAFEHFTNQPPQSLLQFPRQHKNLFAEAAAPTRGAATSSSSQAADFFAVLMRKDTGRALWS